MTNNNKITKVFLNMLLIALSVHAKNSSLPSEEICKLDGRRIYLELGDHGILSTTTFLSKFTGIANTTGCSQCKLEIITCPSCAVHLKFK